MYVPVDNIFLDFLMSPASVRIMNNIEGLSIATPASLSITGHENFFFSIF